MSRHATTLASVVAMLILGGMGAYAGVIEIEGTTGPGALYSISVPDGQDGTAWNGEIVYYAHGYTDPTLPPIPPPSGPGVALRSVVLSHGYAFAASSYSVNGWAVKEGLIQTHALKDIVEQHFGEPTRAYVVGFSMGSGITVALLEKFPAQYAGGLAMCGVLSGAHRTLDYVIEARAVFDYYYPGAIRGDALHVPEDLDPYGEVIPAVIGAVFADSAPAFELAGVDQLDVVTANFGELLNTLLVRLSIHALAVPELLDRTNGASLFDNTEVYYSGTSDDAALNQGVDRFSSEQPGENYYDHYYEPTGDLAVPVLAVHTTRDPLVPVTNLGAYEDRVASAGSSGYLVTQTVDRFGHCSFTEAELETAFLSLVSWVEEGTIPPSGDVTQP